MPTVDSTTDKDKIALLVAGKMHNDWSGYRIDSDFLKPADAWQLSLGLPAGTFPSEVTRGATVRVNIGDETILSGRIDEIHRDISRQAFSLALSGRDDAAILVDCAAQIFSASKLTLDEVVAKIVRPLGITKIRIQAEDAPRNDKVSIEPGERAWDALAKAAAGRGLWPWFDPDGTLVVGGPDYTRAPVATLVMKLDGSGNNMLSLSEARSINGCYSELTVLAQGHAHPDRDKDDTAVVDIWSNSGNTRSARASTTSSKNGQTGKHQLKATATDPTVPYYRPQLVVVGDSGNADQINYWASKKMSDARLTGWDINVEIKGHRTPGGVLWQPGQRVRIVSEPHGFDEIFFLMGRTFSGGRNGQTTSLRFKEDKVWIPDAFPKEKKRRKKKGGKTDVAVVPVWE